jgi:hypothetical protein
VALEGTIQAEHCSMWGLRIGERLLSNPLLRYGSYVAPKGKMLAEQCPMWNLSIEEALCCQTK